MHGNALGWPDRTLKRVVPMLRHEERTFVTSRLFSQVSFKSFSCCSQPSVCIRNYAQSTTIQTHQKTHADRLYGMLWGNGLLLVLFTNLVGLHRYHLDELCSKTLAVVPDRSQCYLPRQAALRISTVSLAHENSLVEGSFSPFIKISKHGTTVNNITQPSFASFDSPLMIFCTVARGKVSSVSDMVRAGSVSFWLLVIGWLR